MFPNAKGSELLAILATIDPSNQAAGAATTGWISAAEHHALLAIVQTGVLGTETIEGMVVEKTQKTLNLSPDGSVGAAHQVGQPQVVGRPGIVW